MKTVKIEIMQSEKSRYERCETESSFYGADATAVQLRELLF